VPALQKPIQNHFCFFTGADKQKAQRQQQASLYFQPSRFSSSYRFKTQAHHMHTDNPDKSIDPWLSFVPTGISWHLTAI